MMQHTYDSLVTTLKNYMEDDFTDFADAIPGLVQQAESKVYELLRLDHFESEQDIAVKPGDGIFVADGVLPRYVYYDDQALEKRQEGYIRFLASKWSGPTTPRYWCRISHDTYRVFPIPSSCPEDVDVPGCWVHVRIKVNNNFMQEDNQTTWLGTYFGDLVFAALLVEAEIFNKNNEAKALREGELTSLVQLRAPDLLLLGRVDKARDASTTRTK